LPLRKSIFTLWVDGSRSSAGHCCLWPRGATRSDVRFQAGRIVASDECRRGCSDASSCTCRRTPVGVQVSFCRDYIDTCTGVSRFAPLHSNCTPLRGRSRCTAVFPGVSVLSKPTPALSKCLKLKCRVTSQAGRRGFESRLPLHLFNNLETSEIHALLRLLRFLSGDRLEDCVPGRSPLP